ncbi:hypothetical protein CRE_04490 [Caenorhabditis remanei]|uniref:Uncharacterized protein n=1 Tax=Caenorhabditis remanei TaxID=31234 RepID=E3NW40_CAERE|nr:hypothetical protein CRE_04490 [Caenorhabditis remanei]
MSQQADVGVRRRAGPFGALAASRGGLAGTAPRRRGRRIPGNLGASGRGRHSVRPAPGVGAGGRGRGNRGGVRRPGAGRVRGTPRRARVSGGPRGRMARVRRRLRQVGGGDREGDRESEAHLRRARGGGAESRSPASLVPGPPTARCARPPRRRALIGAARGLLSGARRLRRPGLPGESLGRSRLSS